MKTFEQLNCHGILGLAAICVITLHCRNTSVVTWNAWLNKLYILHLHWTGVPKRGNFCSLSKLFKIYELFK